MRFGVRSMMVAKANLAAHPACMAGRAAVAIAAVAAAAAIDPF